MRTSLSWSNEGRLRHDGHNGEPIPTSAGWILAGRGQVRVAGWPSARRVAVVGSRCLLPNDEATEA
jgi:hypothetical protein